MTADDYTPTTEDIRAIYVIDGSRLTQESRRKYFDRWLAAHDAELLAELAERDARISRIRTEVDGTAWTDESWRHSRDLPVTRRM